MNATQPHALADFETFLEEEGVLKPAAPNFVNLAPYLSGDFVQEVPSVAEVLPGRSLFYAGRLNEIHGEPGEGKSNIAIAAVNHILAQGGSVLFIDPEDTPQGFSNRALGLGGAAAAIRERVSYLHNPTPEEILAAQAWAAANTPNLVVLDGMAECLTSCNAHEDSNTEVLAFLRTFIRPFADAGCAVLICDHVTKGQDGRGRFARGAGSKLGRYDGAVFQIEMGKAYTPQQEGFVRLRVAKDRTGGLGVPRGQVAFELHFLPGAEHTHAEFRLPPAPGSIKPTIYMEKILKRVATQGPCLKRDLRTLGKSQSVDWAIDLLLDEGKIERTAKGYILAKEAEA
jgi:hypothetical protein